MNGTKGEFLERVLATAKVNDELRCVYNCGGCFELGASYTVQHHPNTQSNNTLCIIVNNEIWTATASLFINIGKIPNTSAKNNQVGGSHYTDLGVQPLELTRRNMGLEAFEGACYTKINKYMIRNKDDKVEQLKKARHVLDMWIEEIEK